MLVCPTKGKRTWCLSLLGRACGSAGVHAGTRACVCVQVCARVRVCAHARVCVCSCWEACGCNLWALLED